MTAPIESAATAIDRLLAVMTALRDPRSGCSWDLQQDWRSIAPFTIEEAYEVADAIAREDWDELRGELGDLLFQVVYYAQLGREEGRFDFGAIADGVADKMVRRHPHVFGPDATGRAVPGSWEQIKDGERKGAASRPRQAGLMGNLPMALPALSRATKIGARAARVAFDWPELRGVFAKLREELDELEAELDAADRDRLADEMGDVLFACANLARRLELDPEQCLRGASDKFIRRFERMETEFAASGRMLDAASHEDREAAWQRAKRAERATEPDIP